MLLERSFEIFLEILSGRYKVFIISKRQSLLSEKFYDRYQMLREGAISNIIQ